MTMRTHRLPVSSSERQLPVHSALHARKLTLPDIFELVQLCTGRDMTIDHEEMELFFALFLMDG